jgi:uncharacterized protein
MAEKLLIVIEDADPSEPETVAKPLFQATVAAAMEYEVEVVLAGNARCLAEPGVAERIVVQPERGKTALDFIRSAVDVGVKFRVCPHDASCPPQNVIPEIESFVERAYIAERAPVASTVMLNY